MVNREIIRFKILLSKKTAKLSQDSLERFAHEVVKEFGGTELLEKVEIRADCENTIKISTDRRTATVVRGAFLLCGEYRTLRCCFRLIV